MHSLLKNQITELFEKWSGEALEQLERLPSSGSDRQYFRVKSAHKTALVAHNQSKKENKAFCDYTTHFRAKGVALPEIYVQDLAQDLYLLQDLGDTTLLQYLEQHRNGATLPLEVVNVYKKALSKLAFMQTKGGAGLEVERYHNPAVFDEQAMLWDVQYFKYCYLKTTKVEFDEHLLERDFRTLIGYLQEDVQNYFMFRDFQSRNIMLHEEEVYFIDYQGGKRGPLQYDVVSLLFQAKANLSPETREELLNHYTQEVTQYVDIDIAKFKAKYYAFVLIRTLQVLGAYGFKGLYERKAHFIASIPFALRNLTWLLEHIEWTIDIAYLKEILQKVVAKELVTPKTVKKEGLTVRIQSFSYKRGIPEDPSGNGGGFVFDCRFIHNPGRYQPYKKLTGRDAPVIEFFKENSTIETFVKKVENIVDEAVETYLERGFSSLCIHFGCTGGQHRSVFSADHIAKHLQAKYPVQIELYHREQERKNWKN